MFRSVLLVLSIVAISAGAIAAPLASSYKSTASITAVGPGTHACPAHEVPVAVSGNGTDPFGDYALTEQFCANPLTGVFAGRFKFAHPGGDSYSGEFNGTFFPSGEVFEVHATWRITEGTSQFSQMVGAGTAKGVATVVNGGPGPGNIVLDGSVVLPTND
jgi:hypothetical protein